MDAITGLYQAFTPIFRWRIPAADIASALLVNPSGWFVGGGGTEYPPSETPVPEWLGGATATLKPWLKPTTIVV